jgi:hypothetical protein
MKAILSTTYDDQYLFYLPITTWAWNRLGIKVICYVSGDNYISPKWEFVFNTLHDQKLQINNFLIFSTEDKQATYAQCSRLYAAALSTLEPEEQLIVGDVDMAVFNKGFFDKLNDGRIHIVGADLVPEGQYPMCYIAMPVAKWREVMMIEHGQTVQYKLDRLLGFINCENFRGNYWAKDQEEAYNHIHLYELVKHNRAAPGTQFATRRADRDGWPAVIPTDIIDAHLSRPGYTEENFSKILNLFQTMYPLDDFTWMQKYRDEYIKLL